MKIMPTTNDVNPAIPVVSKDNAVAVKKPSKQSQWNGRHIVIIVAVVSFVFGAVYLIALKVIETVQRKKMGDLAYYENAVETKFSKEILDIIKKINVKKPINLLRNLSETDENEQKMLQFLKSRYVLTPTTLEQILKGGHIWLPDDGEAFEVWKELTNASPRISSHPADGLQYSVQGPLIRELLFATITTKSTDGTSKKYTWFQLESHSIRTLKDKLSHGKAFITHLITQKNIGPFGNSNHTHKKPLILNRVEPVLSYIKPDSPEAA